MLNEGTTALELNTGIVLISCSSLASELVWLCIVLNLLGGNLLGRFIASSNSQQLCNMELL